MTAAAAELDRATDRIAPGTVVRARLHKLGVVRVFTLGRDGLWRSGSWGIDTDKFIHMATVEQVVA